MRPSKHISLPIFLLFILNSLSAPAAGSAGDHLLSSNVETTLRKDTRVTIEDLIVSTEDSVVFISGTVNSVIEKSYAEMAAKKTRGVQKVVNKLVVKPQPHSDEQITKNISQRLLHSALIDSGKIKVVVVDGEATLMGNVIRSAQAREAVRLASRVSGVSAVHNHLKTFHSPRRFDEDIRKDVVTAIKRDIYLSGLPINISVENGSVLLTGKVGSVYQIDRTARVTRQIADVSKVENMLKVDWQAALVSLETETRLTNEQLHAAVLDELSQDLGITDPYEITIETSLGHVTLRGSVPTSYHKQAAEENAWEITGVSWVSNLLLINTEVRDDEKIREDVQFDLNSDYLLTGQNIDLQVEDAIITLSGTVKTLYEKVCAEDIASRVRGVRNVINHITINKSYDQNDAALWKNIKTRLISNWQTYLVSGRIDISVKDGLVTLSGDVDTWLERHEALRTAYLTKGVREIDNELTIKGKSVPGDKLYNEELEIFSYEGSHPYTSFFFEHPY